MSCKAFNYNFTFWLILNYQVFKFFDSKKKKKNSSPLSSYQFITPFAFQKKISFAKMEKKEKNPNPLFG